MADLETPYAVMCDNGVLYSTGLTIGEAQRVLPGFRAHPSVYSNPRIVKLGIVDNDPVIEKTEEQIFYGFLYRYKLGGNNWSAAAQYRDKKEADRVRDQYLKNGSYDLSEVTEQRYTVKTTEKVNK